MTSKQRRKSPSNGWSKMAPKKGKDRNDMLKKCGSKCFLDPKNKKYPICAKGSCKVNKKGLHAAYSRSRQWNREKIASTAKKKLSKGKRRPKKSKSRPKKSGRRPKKSRRRPKKSKCAKYNMCACPRVRCMVEKECRNISKCPQII